MGILNLHPRPIGTIFTCLMDRPSGEAPGLGELGRTEHSTQKTEWTSIWKQQRATGGGARAKDSNETGVQSSHEHLRRWTSVH